MVCHEDEGHRGLWRAVIKQAEHDLLRAPESEALDALEFLRTTGVWLWSDVFGTMEVSEAKQYIAALVLARNRRTGEDLPLWRLTK